MAKPACRTVDHAMGHPRVLVPLVASFALTLAAVAAQAPRSQPTQAQQLPVFRGGTHFVRVDAYPVGRDGRILEGLTADDFEITEDGKPQKIESFDFIRFDSFTPDAERRDPRSQREGFDMAADPRYRVFVIVVDMLFSGTDPMKRSANIDIHRIQQPLIQFLDRVLGPNDLFGFLTSRNSVKDLVLAQKATVTQSQIADLLRAANIDRDHADELFGCDCGNVKTADECDALIRTLQARWRLDDTYTMLDDLVAQLGSLREERKNVVFASNMLPRWRPDPSLLQTRGATLPKAGITRGRLGVGDRTVGSNDAFCASQFQRLAMLDFDDRYRMLLDEARRQNVSFYVITPEGLSATQRADDNLIALANDTDGIAIVNTNDLTGGMKKIADDLAAYYVLGYYTTNTTWDGRVRTIKVKRKPSGATIRARRQYRAPTQAEINALAYPSSASSTAAAAAAAAPRETALAGLERASRPFAAYAAISGTTMTVVAELSGASIQAGKWKDGADVEVTASGAGGEPMGAARGRIEAGTYAAVVPAPLGGTARPSRVSVALRSSGEAPAMDWLIVPPEASAFVGDPIAYRSASRIVKRPVAGFEFARNERITVEWPVLAPLDRREVRLLDRRGAVLPLELPLAEDVGRNLLVVDMSVSGFGKGDYLIELTIGRGETVERRLLAIRIKQ